MNDINFLPQSYRDRLRRRVRQVREGVAIVAAVIALGAWWAYDANELIQLRDASRFAEDRLTSALSTEQRVKQLEARRAKLIDQRRLQREVRVPIRHHQVIRMLGGLMPPSVALTRLSLENDRPEPKPYRPPSAREESANEPSFGSRPSESALSDEPDRVLVELEGLAPDDIAVAELISELNAHPLFDGVKLHTSKFLETRGVAARSFRITGEIDLARRIVWIDPASDASASGLVAVPTEDAR
ncbi:MAG: PilN domain-containing protein [Planctomycetota bacterium]